MEAVTLVILFSLGCIPVLAAVPTKRETCPEDMFKCANSQCIRIEHLCDSDKDCPDGSDELPFICLPRKCSKTEFKCKGGQCIDEEKECDYNFDCLDGSDEDPDICRNRTSPETEFICASGQRIPAEWRCNSKKDCFDGSDEVQDICANGTCSDTEFKCENGVCIPASYVCDKDNDCRDGSDELPAECLKKNCSESEFRCANGHCISISYICDNDKDCPDGSDESLASCENKTCDENQYKCDSGQCVFSYNVCDTEDNCLDGSDEDTAFCSNRTCLENEFKCSSGQCIAINRQCDYRSECKDGYDEDPTICSADRNCSETEFKCARGHCIPLTLRCDYVEHCNDGSDEDPAVCSTKRIETIETEVFPGNRVPEGCAVTIKCNTTGSSYVQYIWSVNGEDVPSRWTNNVLRRDRLSRDEAGVYTCTAKNGINTLKNEENLVVLGSPIVQVPASEKFIYRGLNHSFSCNVSSHSTVLQQWSFQKLDEESVTQIFLGEKEHDPDVDEVIRSLNWTDIRKEYDDLLNDICHNENETKYPWEEIAENITMNYKVNNSRSVNGEGVTVDDGNRNNSLEHTTAFRHVMKVENPGILICFSMNIVGSAYKVIPILLTDIKDGMTSRPKVWGMPNRVLLGMNFTLTCAASVYSGSQFPAWKANYIDLKNNTLGTVMHQGKTEYTYFNNLTFLNISEDHHKKTFSCYRGKLEGEQQPVFVEDDSINSAFPAIEVGVAAAGSTLLLLIILVLYIWFRKSKRLSTVLSFYGLANFEKGAMQRFNPELTLQEQADLLPYDKKWEFPRGKLKLGRQLGSGAFGVVTEAIALGIVEKNKTTTVAVKTTKLGADHTSVQNLASELKIMTHIGKHLNVINLLGACTRKLGKLELMVIVEFCPHDNVHKYIQLFRDDFMDQVDRATGELKPALCKDVSEILQPAEIRSTNNIHVTLLPSLLCTEMLLWWAYQIAKGMEYLSSKKILHGDLAARNILLADSSIVKVSDFGLSSSLYKSDYYRKSTSTPLPLKWMAPEAIAERLFSTQSDVWSYGIVLWEMFAHSRVPYPEMEADERLYLKLVRGYRMEKPRFATNSIYNLMRQCWRVKAIDRPSFTELANQLENVINHKLVEHHKDLNIPYEKMNDESDYLSKARRPTYKNRLKRMTTKRVKNQYVQNPTTATADDEGYLTVISAPEPQPMDGTILQEFQPEMATHQLDVCLDIHCENDDATQERNIEQLCGCLQDRIQDSNNESRVINQITIKGKENSSQNPQTENNSSAPRKFKESKSTDTGWSDRTILERSLQEFQPAENMNFSQGVETREDIENEEINTKL